MSKVHEQSKGRKRAYDQLLADPETRTLVAQLREIRQKGRANHVLHEELEADLERAVGNEKRIEQQINSLVSEIEAFAHKLSGAEVKLQVS